jgi:hypothetical protein
MDKSRGGIETNRQPLLTGRETESDVGLAGAGVPYVGFLALPGDLASQRVRAISKLFHPLSTTAFLR